MAYKERAKGRHFQHTNKGISLAYWKTVSSVCLEMAEEWEEMGLKKSAEAILEKPGCQTEELDLVLEVMKNRVFGKLILEAISEE